MATMIPREELASRTTDGLDVSLFWSPEGNRLAVEVADMTTGEHFTLPARPENALDVFYHPCAYAALR